MKLKSMFVLLLLGLTFSVAFGQEVRRSSQQQPRPELNPQQTQFMNTVRARIREALQQERGREDTLWEQMNGIVQNLDYLQNEQKNRDLTSRERARLQELQMQLQITTRTMSSERDARQRDREVIVRLERTYIAWRRTPFDANWLAMTDALTQVAVKKGINSNVRIVSKDPGAAIKYHTAHDKSKGLEPFTANQQTVCIETMPIGHYHIWLERGGKATSDKNTLFFIAASEEEINIVEPGRQ